jgi:hypothetical protein
MVATFFYYLSIVFFCTFLLTISVVIIIILMLKFNFDNQFNIELNEKHSDKKSKIQLFLRWITLGLFGNH